MALKQCRECGQDVAATAKLCPGCGVKHPTLGPDAVKAQAAATVAYSAGCIGFVILAMIFVFALLIAILF
jgi:hypothetical protein